MFVSKYLGPEFAKSWGGIRIRIIRIIGTCIYIHYPTLETAAITIYRYENVLYSTVPTADPQIAQWRGSGPKFEPGTDGLEQ